MKRALLALLAAIITAGAWPAVFALIWSGPIIVPLLTAHIVLALWGGSAIAAAGVCVWLAFQRNWLGAMAMLTLPVTALAAAMNLEFVWRSGQRAGEYVHFIAMLPFYLHEIAELPANEPRLLVIEWGGLLPLASHGVVYDESDEIALPAQQQSEAWKKRASRTIMECVTSYTSVGGHFYLVSLDC